MELDKNNKLSGMYTLKWRCRGREFVYKWIKQIEKDSRGKGISFGINSYLDIYYTFYNTNEIWTRFNIW